MSTKLITATSAHALAVSKFDLSAILDQADDLIEGAANQGLFHASANIRGSIYENFLPQIRDALVARGYVVSINTPLAGDVSIDW